MTDEQFNELIYPQAGCAKARELLPCPFCGGDAENWIRCAAIA